MGLNSRNLENKHEKELNPPIRFSFVVVFVLFFCFWISGILSNYCRKTQNIHIEFSRMWNTRWDSRKVEIKILTLTF